MLKAAGEALFVIKLHHDARDIISDLSSQKMRSVPVRRYAYGSG